MLAGAQNFQEFSVLGENLDAIVESVRSVNFAVVPDQAGRTLELAGFGAESAEREQKTPVGSEFLHAIVGAVFGDVEILLGVFGHSHRINKFPGTVAFLSESLRSEERRVGK